MITVAFTGQDGTGKSTQIGLLRERLVGRGLSCVVVHQYAPAGAVARGIAPWAKAVANRWMRRNADPSKSTASGGGALGELAAIASLVAGRRRARSNLRLSAGHDVLLLDRCFLDEIVRVAYKFGAGEERGFAMLSSMPRPDLAFALSVDARTGWERKKTRELSLEEYRGKLEAIRRVIGRAGDGWSIVELAVDGRGIEEVSTSIWTEVEGRLGSTG